MAQKKYPALFERIEQFQRLVAYNTLCMTGQEAEDFIVKSTRNRYRAGCILINDGVFTEEELINEFPLD